MRTVSEIIIDRKILKTLDMVCSLYVSGLITNAYITGSLAENVADDDSIIEITLVNPLIFSPQELSLDSAEQAIVAIGLYLRDVIGAKFEYIKFDDDDEYIMKYEEEIFYVLISSKYTPRYKEPYINITRNICKKWISTKKDIIIGHHKLD